MNSLISKTTKFVVFFWVLFPQAGLPLTGTPGVLMSEIRINETEYSTTVSPNEVYIQLENGTSVTGKAVFNEITRRVEVFAKDAQGNKMIVLGSDGRMGIPVKTEAITAYEVEAWKTLVKQFLPALEAEISILKEKLNDHNTGIDQISQQIHLIKTYTDLLPIPRPFMVVKKGTKVFLVFKEASK